MQELRSYDAERISLVIFMVKSRTVVLMLAVSGDFIISRRTQLLSDCCDIVLNRELPSSRIFHTYCSFIGILLLRMALLLLCCVPIYSVSARNYR
jgi:hypothetical protein